MQVNSYKDLIVWQRAVELVIEVYRVSDTFPRREMYSLTDQIRRAASAIPANIAEGRARGTRRDFARFVSMARGSLAELETHLIVAERLGYSPSSTLATTHGYCSEVGRMLNAMWHKLVATDKGESQKLKAKS